MGTTPRILGPARAGSDGLERAGGRLVTWWAEADRFLRRQPLRVIAVAAGLGYAVGWLLRRR